MGHIFHLAVTCMASINPIPTIVTGKRVIVGKTFDLNASEKPRYEANNGRLVPRLSRAAWGRG